MIIANATCFVNQENNGTQKLVIVKKNMLIIESMMLAIKTNTIMLIELKEIKMFT